MTPTHFDLDEALAPAFEQDGLRIFCGDCIEVMRSLPEKSVRTCVTSPPYFGLRDYGVDGQIGLEPTPAEYVAKMVEVFREVRRLLTDDGTCWVNLGDSYAGSWGNAGGHNRGSGVQRAITVGSVVKDQAERNGSFVPPGANGFKHLGIKPKDLIGIPWRVAFALQADGWYLRSEIIWAKPAPMPESVTDRPTRSHEMVYLFAKSERYFYNRLAARDPLKPSSVSRLSQNIDEQLGSDRANGGAKTNGRMKASRFGGNKSEINDQTRLASGNEWQQDPSAGANWRDVWTIGHEGFDGSHFAVMPQTLAYRCMIAGSAAGDVVLDPFNGSGTTGHVCREHGRRYIGIELNPKYVELTRTRFAQPILFPPQPSTDADQQSSKSASRAEDEE